MDTLHYSHSCKELPKKKEDIKVAQRYHRLPPSHISKGINFYTMHMCISFLIVLIEEESIHSKRLNLSIKP